MSESKRLEDLATELIPVLSEVEETQARLREMEKRLNAVCMAGRNEI